MMPGAVVRAKLALGFATMVGGAVAFVLLLAFVASFPLWAALAVFEAALLLGATPEGATAWFFGTFLGLGLVWLRWAKRQQRGVEHG